MLKIAKYKISTEIDTDSIQQQTRTIFTLVAKPANTKLETMEKRNKKTTHF